MHAISWEVIRFSTVVKWTPPKIEGRKYPPYSNVVDTTHAPRQNDSLSSIAYARAQQRQHSEVLETKDDLGYIVIRGLHGTSS